MGSGVRLRCSQFSVCVQSHAQHFFRDDACDEPVKVGEEKAKDG